MAALLGADRMRIALVRVLVTIGDLRYRNCRQYEPGAKSLGETCQQTGSKPRHEALIQGEL
jgi:hypothetical protein